MTSRTVWLTLASLIALAANLFADSAIGPAGGGVVTACNSCHGGIFLNAAFADPVTSLYPGQSAVYTVNIDKMTAELSPARVGLNVYGPFGNFELADSDPLTYFSDQVVHSTFGGTKALHSFASSTSTSYQFGFRVLGPAPGTTVQLRAVSAAGHGANEVGVAATTVDILVLRPATPSGIAATAVGSTTADLTWSGTGPGYRVVYKPGFGFPNAPNDGSFVDTDSTSVTVASLTPSTTYTFAVYGRASFGVDTFSGDASFVTITTPSVTSANYYVDAIAGSNANDGSSGAPWQTITHALTIAHAGDTVNVRQGTYNVALGETFPILLVTGVTLVSTSGAAVTIIDATGANEIVIGCFQCASNTLFEGFTVTRGLIDFSFRIAIIRGGGGISGVLACHAVFRRNIITRNEARGGDGSGSTIYGGGVAVRSGAARFENNVISYNIARAGSGQPGTSSQVGGDGGSANGAGIWFEDAFDAQFVNNTVYGNVALAGRGGDSIPPSMGGRGGSAFGGGVGGTGYHAFNNIIVSNQTVAGQPGGPVLGPSGVSNDGGLYSFSASNTLNDNLYFHNQPNDANAPGVPAIFADPLFTSAATSDFHLSVVSPARGAGTSVGAPLRDVENTLRASPPTIGAYETGLLLTATPGIGRIVVTWPSLPGASSYNLYMSRTAGVTKSTFEKVITGATSPYVLAPLLNNTTYYFVITAIENSVEGSISPEVSATSANGTWVKSLAGMNFTAITTDMNDGMMLYAANDALGVYRSRDGGNNWINLPGTSGKIRALAANKSTVFAAADTGDIFKSTNGGGNWATVASLGAQGEPVQSIAIDPFATDTIYTGDYPTGPPYLFKSIDGGTSWNHVTSGGILAYVLQVDPVTAGTLWAAGTGTPNISRSTDGGITWSPAAGQAGSLSPANGFVYAFALAPSQPLTLYARVTHLSSEPYGVQKTTNGGSNWTLMSTGVPATNPRYNALFVDPADANRVHAGTELGYYTTTNGGSNWAIGPEGGLYPSSSLSFRAFAQTSNRRLLGTTISPGALFMMALDAPPSISTVTRSFGSSSGGDSVTVAGSGFTVAAALRVLFGGVDGVVSPGGSSTSITVMTPANTAGIVDVAVINPDGQAAIRAGGFTYHCAVELSPAAANYSAAAATGSVQVSLSSSCTWTATSPGGSFVTITGGASGNGSGTVSYSVAQNTSSLSRSSTLTIAGRSFVVTQSAAGVVTMMLTANASSSQVLLSWTSTPGATSYDIQRSSNGGAFAAINSSGGTVYPDSTAVNGTGYLYRIRAIGSGGTIAYSNIDLAVPFNYTWPSIVSGATIIHAVDMTELRQVANAARAALGWAASSFTDPILTSVTVKTIHMTQVRLVIDGVRTGVGLSGLTYTDASVAAGVTLIRGAHITEARAGLQ